jgi:hydrogenase maturation factor
LVSIGQAAEHLLRSLELDNSVNEDQANETVKALERMFRGEHDDK